MKPRLDYNKNNRIRLFLGWMKGLKMDIPNSKWVMFSIGIYIICAAAERLIPLIRLFM